MSHVDRNLTEQELNEVVVALRGELERRLKVLSEDKIMGSNRELNWRCFHLEFDVVSPLYYKLQRHLIDWGTRKEHTEFSDLKLAKWLDERGYRYYDIIPLRYREK